MISFLQQGAMTKSAPQIFGLIILVIVVVAVMNVIKKYKELEERNRQRELDFMATYERALLEQKSKAQQDQFHASEATADLVRDEEKTPEKSLSMKKNTASIQTEKIDRKVKMVVLDGTALNPGDLSWKIFEQFGDITVYDRSTPDQVIDRIGDAEIIFTNKTVLNREILQACPHVKYIGVNATGYNVVDLAAAKDAGMIVTNIPSYGTDAVAQFTFALLLELCNHVGLHNQSVQMGSWKLSPDFSFFLKPLTDLAGKTMGIIGYGAIGSKVAEIAKAFGMKIMVYSRTMKDTDPDIVWGTLEEVLTLSDVVSLHCPLTSENKELMNRTTFAKMKKGAYLINTARGGLVNEKDLVQALKTGQLAGAAVDVISAEPMTSDSPLIGVDNLIITPHIAWASHEARERLMNIAVDNLKMFLAGTPINVVN